MLVGSKGFMGVFNLDKMEQTLILPPQFDGNDAYSITKIINSTFAVGTSEGVYMIDISKKDRKPTIMLKGKWVTTVKLINNGNILCGTYNDGYYLLDIGRKEEKKLATGERQRVLNMCLLSSIDAKYNNLALTLETSTVNILNMENASIIKIADVVTSKWSITDSQMQITKSSNEENFSFVFISGDEEISAFTVRRELADLCLSR